MWPRKSTTKNNQTFGFVRVAPLGRPPCLLGSAHFRSLKVLTFFLLIIAGECQVNNENSGEMQLSDPKVSGPCVNFTFGFDGEFFSPEYPANYPNSTKCLKTLTAPHGHVIRLEFRDRFCIERSDNCQHDYLQIRDGAYGYSPVIGQFCGNTFPSELTSKDRCLWLKFVSDENIECTGFRIAYKFINNIIKGVDRPEIQPCSFNLTGLEGIFGRVDIPEKYYWYSRLYQVPLSCIWEIVVPNGLQISLHFLDYVLEKVNECEHNYISILPDLHSDVKLKEFCGKSSDAVTAYQNRIFLVFYAETIALNSNFSVLFSAHRNTSSPIKKPCDPYFEVDCEDNTCVDLSLRCNGNNNCEYSKDEINCQVKTETFLASQQVLIILVIGISLLLSILVPSCWKCYRKFKEQEEDDSPGGEVSAQTSVGQRTVEGSLHEQQALGVTSGTYGGRTNTGVSVDDDDGCYVPEVDLSIFEKRRSNGGHAILQEDQLLAPFCSMHEPSLDSTLPFDSADPLIATAPPPPLLPLIPLQLLRNTQSKNQRNAFQDGRPRGNPLRTSTPPLPPPPPNPYSCPNQDNVNNGYVETPYNSDTDNNNLFLTFLPPPPTLEEVEESDAIFGLPAAASPSGGRRRGGDPRTNNPRQFKAEAVIEMSQRPRSFESTKSAPDVIGRV